MTDNKKYYYLKLKDNFFDSDEMVILEGMPDGYLYSNILLKLYLKSLKNEGKLMFNDRIPFNSNMLSQITRHQVGVIEKAVKIFKELGLIEVLDNGAIYMTDIQNFIGRSSTEADRIRQYRARIEADKADVPTLQEHSYKCNNKCTPELELELEKDNNVQNAQHSGKNAKALESDFEKLWKLYPNKKGKQVALKAYKRAIKDGVSNKQIQDGIVAYKKYLTANGTEQQYMMHGGTFFNQRSWDDDWSISQSQPTKHEKVPENLIDDIYNSQ